MWVSGLAWLGSAAILCEVDSSLRSFPLKQANPPFSKRGKGSLQASGGEEEDIVKINASWALATMIFDKLQGGRSEWAPHSVPPGFSPHLGWLSTTLHSHIPSRLGLVARTDTPVGGPGTAKAPARGHLFSRHWERRNRRDSP